MRPDGRELLVSNLDLIERVITFTCRRNHLNPNDAEEFRSIVKLNLVENDYAILGKFEARSRFSTFITVVVQRMLLDYRIHLRGKWHPSAEAERLGPIAVDIERLTVRDGRAVQELLPLLKRTYADVTPEFIEAIAAKLPTRPPRPRQVPLDEATSLGRNDAEDTALAGQRERTSALLSAAMKRIICDLPPDQRTMLELRFGCGMTVAQIARTLHQDQRLLYRRLRYVLDDVRVRLEHEGVTSAEVLDLIGRNQIDLDFSLGKAETRPSTVSGGTIEANQEEASS